MKFSKLNYRHAVLISYKFYGDWSHCYKTIRGKVLVIVYTYRQSVCMQKLRHKNQLDALIQFAYILVDL